jgi:heptosyltransferase I
VGADVPAKASGFDAQDPALKILILKPSSLGDVVQALPVLRLIKLHRPESEVYWWIDANLAPLLYGDPDLAGVVKFERRKWARPANLRQLWLDLQWVREQHFDWVIDLQCLARSGIFSWLARGNFTVGLDESREGARGFYDRAARRASFHTHAVDWYLEVLKFLRVPVHRDFEWLPVRKSVAEGIRRKWPVEERPWVILQPGARWLNKRWPVEHFRKLMEQVAEKQPEVGFAVLGGADERPLARSILDGTQIPSVDLCGQLSLLEMVEWIRACRLMVTNDTGPMHVAAALRKPLVALFGPTEPARTGPYGQLGHALRVPLPCVPCLKDTCYRPIQFECLKSLPPSVVAETVRRRLSSVLPQVSKF